ncbi:MAG TPA: hypothetical protein VJ672_02955 [Gemmatimonadaceae bacterium]|nr:hypothetical protein [Gemmatimonadaceae bacterium]
MVHTDPGCLSSVAAKSIRRAAVAARRAIIGASIVASSTACGPRARIPERPLVIPGALDAQDSGAVLARQLAPTLYLQRDETFPLSRAVAVVHPTRRMIAYHLLWRDDANGAWVPFTRPTDQEIVWVGYDSTGAPTDIWTYWHGHTLHADWRGKGQVLADVQWGKHGSMPRGTINHTLPPGQTLDAFYFLSFLLLPDFWLGNLNRKGPWGFFHGFGRYKTFDKPLLLGERLDAIVRTDEPDEALKAVFGRNYSRKRSWPDQR